ncbi:MAG: hypothetical protein Q9227_007413 [Pyrenula ochraceoflavens]
MPSPTAPSDDKVNLNRTIRLYISPLTPELAHKILPSDLRFKAEQVSYHSAQNSPFTSYGFLDLPHMEAEKLQKKLNGSILKGKKLRLEEARPRKRLRTDDPENDVSGDKQTVKEEVSVKKDADLEGHKLSHDRKVKRGWTEPKKNRKKGNPSEGPKESPVSRYSEHEECLFHTKVPPNRSDEATNLPSDKKNKKSKKGHDTTVHEFEKSSTHPSFLRSGITTTQSSSTTSFVDGKGWVNEAGDLVELAPPPKKTKSKKKAEAASGNSDTAEVNGTAIQLSSGDASIDKTVERDRQPPVQNGRMDDLGTTTGPLNGANISDETSSSGSSSISENDKTPSEADLSGLPVKPEELKTDEAHPLETIFKRPKRGESDSANKPNLEISTSFSFFDQDPDIETETPMPTTPFTRHDLQSRSLRSAAPTPDTAAPYKTTFFQPGQAPSSHPGHQQGNVNREHADPNGLEPEVDSGTPTASKEPANFAHMFFEKRGETHRGWKKQHREKAKEKRQQENRERGRRFGRT